MPRSRRSGETLSSARSTYLVELARGCSHIASMLTPETEQRAIREVIEEFLKLYGQKDTALFQTLLAEELQLRKKSAAAHAVRAFKSTNG